MAFFGKTSPLYLAEKYGTPLYVYSESILRERCRELTNLISYQPFHPSYSAKANSNIKLLSIIREEGLNLDAVSIGEVIIGLKAGFKPEQIFFVANNVSEEEIKQAVDYGVLISVDSISQMERFGKINKGGRVALRINPGIGAGHHAKVITGGQGTKFGVELSQLDSLQQIVSSYNITIVGLNQHIGSLFMDPKTYIEGAKVLLSIAHRFPDLEFIDYGGGFGIPYRKKEKEKRLNLVDLGERLDSLVKEWGEKNNRIIGVKIEPGRYVIAESGIVLTQVHAIKENYGTVYVGTDAGFNVLIRPAMYDAYHEIEVYHAGNNQSEDETLLTPKTIVGNICETGDVIAKDRLLPPIFENDILGILDAGAYGWSMSSNYNSRLRPAEVLIRENGDDLLIRKRDTWDDLIKNCICQE